jgi:hypothetical protein
MFGLGRYLIVARVYRNLASPKVLIIINNHSYVNNRVTEAYRGTLNSAPPRREEILIRITSHFRRVGEKNHYSHSMNGTPAVFYNKHLFPNSSTDTHNTDPLPVLQTIARQSHWCADAVQQEQIKNKMSFCTSSPMKFLIPRCFCHGLVTSHDKETLLFAIPKLYVRWAWISPISAAATHIN